MKEEINIKSILKIINAEKKSILLIVLLIVICTGFYSLIMPCEYSSNASLLPPNQKDASSGLSSFMQNIPGGFSGLMGGIGESGQAKIFAEVLQSRSVANFICDSMHLYNNSFFIINNREKLLKFMQEKIDVEVPKSGVIKLGISLKTKYFPNSSECDSVAKLTSLVLNYAIKGLDNIIRNSSIYSSKKAKEYIERALEMYKVRLDSVETKFEAFQKSNKVLAIDEQTKAILEQSNLIGFELAKAELQLNIAQQELTPGTPSLKMMENNVSKLREQYKKIQSGGLTQNDAFSIPLENVPKLAREYTDLFRSKKLLEQVLVYLNTQLFQEAIQEKKDVPVVQILDAPNVPEERISPKRTSMVLFSLIIGFALTIIYKLVKALIKGELYFKKV